MSRTFDTSPLGVRQSRATYRAFKRTMLATDFGRRKNARAVKFFWGFLGAAVGSGIFLVLWTRQPVRSWMFGLYPLGPLEYIGALTIFGLFFLLSAFVFTPGFGLSLTSQWSALYATREFAAVNGLERHDAADDDRGDLSDKARWRGLIFLQGFAPRAVLSFTAKAAPAFEIGVYQYARRSFQTRGDRLAHTSKNVRETWGYLRVPLEGAVDVPRIVVRPAADLAPSSGSWDQFTYLEPYWQNPGEAVGDAATYGLFAPQGAERAAKAFFTPAVIDLLVFDDALLEAEVVGDAFYIYKKKTPWRIGASATYRWLEEVLATVDLGVFTRLALEAGAAPAPTPAVTTAQDRLAPLTLTDGKRPFVVTGPATPPDGDPGGVTESGGRPRRP